MFKQLIALAALITATTLISTQAATPTVDTVLQVSAPADVRAGSTFTVTARRVVKNTNTGVPKVPVEWQWYGLTPWTYGGTTDSNGYTSFKVKAAAKGGATYTLCLQSPKLTVTIKGRTVIANRAYATVKIHVR
jgi:hypothetical protein